MPPLKISEKAFAAMLSPERDSDAYFDTHTGYAFSLQRGSLHEVRMLLKTHHTLSALEEALTTFSDLSEEEREQLLDVARVETDEEGRFLPVPSSDGSDDYETMQAYVWSVDDKQIYRALDMAIQGDGAFRRFKEELVKYPAARKRWFEFREERHRERILTWLASVGVDAEAE